MEASQLVRRKGKGMRVKLFRSISRIKWWSTRGGYEALPKFGGPPGGGIGLALYGFQVGGGDESGGVRNILLLQNGAEGKEVQKIGRRGGKVCGSY